MPQPQNSNHSSLSGIATAILKAMYVAMVQVRLFEEKVAGVYPEQEIRCPCHLCLGQEAAAVGVCFSLRREDYVFGTHRGHGIYIAKGGDLKPLAAELYGKSTGCAKGKGGSMHVIAPEVGLLGTSSIVGGDIPLAVGAALAARLQENGKVAVAFFGDGAVDEGSFHESLNFASLRKLPVLFVCENNFYATHSHQLARQPSDNIYKRATAYGMPGVRVDGNDVVAVFRAARRAVKRARNGEGPTLLECRTYRWKEHVGPNFDYQLGYRSKEELDMWMERCPLNRYQELLLKAKVISEADVHAIYTHVHSEVDEAIAFAKTSPVPEPDELAEDVYAG